MRTWMFCVACSISQVFKHLHLLNISSSYFVSNAFFSGLTNIPSALLIFFEKDDTSAITVKQSFKTKLRSYYHVVISILITDNALVSTSDKSDSQYMEIFREFRTSWKAPYLVSCWSNLRLFFCHVLNVGWDHITLHIPFYYYRWSDIFFLGIVMESFPLPMLLNSWFSLLEQNSAIPGPHPSRENFRPVC